MTRTAVIAGVGPGLGEALARRFVDEDCRVGLFARSTDYLTDLADDLGADAASIPTDLTDPDAIRQGFATVRDTFGPVDVLVYNASAGGWNGLENTTLGAFERSWQVGPAGALLCTREAVADMRPQADGTVVFTGATSAVRGRGGALGFSATKFALRGMAESLARELGSVGIHVAHVVIDGQIDTPALRDAEPDRDPSELLDPSAIADAYWHLVEQDRSAWTLELDLRPHVEAF